MKNIQKLAKPALFLFFILGLTACNKGVGCPMDFSTLVDAVIGWFSVGL